MLQAFITVLFIRHDVYTHEKMQANHALGTILSAREALLYGRAQKKQHFTPMFTFLTNTYNQNTNISIYTSPHKPTDAIGLPASKLSIDRYTFNKMTQSLIHKGNISFSTPILLKQRQTWVVFAATLTPIHTLSFYLLLIGLPLLVFIILWACFLFYFRYTLSSEILYILERPDHIGRHTNAMLLHLKNSIQMHFNEKNLMITALAHDIKTPLTEAMLRLEFMPDQKSAEPIIANLNHIKSIITSSLEFSRPHYKIQKRTIELISFIERMIESYQDDELELILNTLIKHYEVDVEMELFRRMLTNIIENAKKYATCCVIGIKHKPKHLIITLTDNGLGVPEEFLQKLTVPYLRVDQSRSSKTGGSGLGLAIVKKIAELHDGTVEFENLPNHTGFRVTIILETPI